MTSTSWPRTSRIERRRNQNIEAGQKRKVFLSRHERSQGLAGFRFCATPRNVTELVLALTCEQQAHCRKIFGTLLPSTAILPLAQSVHLRKAKMGEMEKGGGEGKKKNGGLLHIPRPIVLRSKHLRRDTPAK
jgi:hypothetical protein